MASQRDESPGSVPPVDTCQDMGAQHELNVEKCEGTGNAIEVDEAAAAEPASAGDAKGREISENLVLRDNYIEGPRLYALTCGLCLSLLLSSMEITIVSTSLLAIADALRGFDEVHWVVVAYLLTYTGLLVIYSRFSDLLGRKTTIVFAICAFIIFSVICGSVNSVVILTIFRAFQGIGGSGINALVTIITPEMVPPRRWGTMVSVTALVFVFSSILGPILGGIIGERDWRWVFLLNGPVGAVALALVVYFLPNNFPNHAPGPPDPFWRNMASVWAQFSWKSISRLDVLGAFLLLSASVLTVFAFEEAGVRFPWSSPAIIASICLAGVLFAGFVFWERLVSRPSFAQDPVFPLRLLRDRKYVGMVVVSICVGPPFMIAIISLPQRFQAVSGASPFDAGIRLLPLLLSSTFATGLSGQLATRANVAPQHLMQFGATLQVIGLGLASFWDGEDVNKMYGYEVLMGFSFGMVAVTILMFVPMLTTRADFAVSMGVANQSRLLGATIGLAASVAAMNNYINPRLANLLSSEQLEDIAQSAGAILDLPDQVRSEVQIIYNDGYNQQLRVALGISGACWLATWLLFQKKPLRAKGALGT